MQIKLFPDWPNLVGRKQAFVGSGTGPALYVLGGDVVTLTGYNTYIDALNNSTSLSGTYNLRAIPSIAGPRAVWKLQWIVFSTGLEVAANTVLSGESAVVSGFASGT